MGLEKFKDANKNELSMIEVAHAVLNEQGDVMAFADLTNKIQDYLKKSDQEIRRRLPQFYTDLNVDGSFISLGDNRWGLRSWYPFESIDEALVHSDEDEEQLHKKRKKVNAFIADDAEDDVIYDGEDDVEDYDDNNQLDLKYHSDIDDDDEDNGLSDGIEGQLTEISTDDDDALEDN